MFSTAAQRADLVAYQTRFPASRLSGPSLPGCIQAAPTEAGLMEAAAREGGGLFFLYASVHLQSRWFKAASRWRHVIRICIACAGASTGSVGRHQATKILPQRNVAVG